MRKLVQFVKKKPLGVKTYKPGQKAVIQGGLADALETQGFLIVLETDKEPKKAEEKTVEPKKSDDQKAEKSEK